MPELRAPLVLNERASAPTGGEPGFAPDPETGIFTAAPSTSAPPDMRDCSVPSTPASGEESP